MECDHGGRASTTLSEEEEREMVANTGFSKPLQTLSGLNYCTCWALETTRHRDGHTTPEADVIHQYLGLLRKQLETTCPHAKANFFSHNSS